MGTRHDGASHLDRPRGGNRITRAFGLTGDAWLRHANPASVWTRFAVLPMIVISIWSRDWIGWFCVIPLVLSLVWLFVNPLCFPPPTSTDHWASKSVLGERVWTESDRSSLPAAFRSAVPGVAQTLQIVGLVPLVYGLVVLDPVAAITGVVIVQIAKLWYLDRMVLLFDHVRSGVPEYASWER
jgi:hypothetical protein